MALEDQKQSKPSQVCVPTEIVQEILFRLSVVSLLRCNCVCKLWFSLISDPYFINRHTKNSESAQRHLRQLLLTIPETHINIQTCYVCDVLHDKADNALEIDHPFKDEVKNIWIVGTCNGLFCLRFGNDHHITYCIWNPSTRRSSKRFSPSDKRCLVYGFGFGYDESTDDYKVVELSRPLNNGTQSDDTFATHICSLKTRNWKNFRQIPKSFVLIYYSYNGTFWNGALHWVARKLQTDVQNLRSIVSFDLATMTYSEVSTPPYEDKSIFTTLPKLGAFGESLCVLCTHIGRHAELWVYEGTDSWVNLFSIPYPTHFQRGLSDVFSAPSCNLDDGKILVQFGSSKLVVYDSKNNSSFSEIRSFDKRYDAVTFVESLVSPDS